MTPPARRAFCSPADIVATAERRPAIDIGTERRNDPLQGAAEIAAGDAGWKLDGIDLTRAEIGFAGDHDLAVFGFMRPGIGGAAEIHLFGAEQNDADGAAGMLGQAADKPGPRRR